MLAPFGGGGGLTALRLPRRLRGAGVALAVAAGVLAIPGAAAVQNNPDRPSGLAAEALCGGGGVELTWVAPTADVASVDGYQVLRRRPGYDPVGTFHVLIDNTESTETSYIDATATTVGQRYTYRVKARRAEVLSGRSGYTFADIPDTFDCPQPPPPPDNHDNGEGNSDEVNNDGVPVGNSIVKIDGNGEQGVRDEANKEDPKPDLNVLKADVQTETVAFPSRSFGLVSGNTDSEGLWGDGSTLWALDSTDRKGYAYGLDDPGTAVDELGARRSSSDVTVPSSISIEGAGVDTANTKVFIGDYQATTVSVRVFSLSGFSRLAGEDFDLPRISAGGSELLRSPSGFLSDGTTLWQVTAGVKSIHAFSLVDDPNTGADEYGARDSAKDIEVSFLPGAMWSDGDTMWVLDDAGDRLAAFDWPTRTANPTRDIALHTKHDDPGQVWGHNGALYSLQLDDNKVYAYQYLNNASGLVVAGGGEPGDVLSADPSGIVDPNGLADGFDPALRWQRSRDNGETWANIDGQTGTEYEIRRSDRGALVRVVAVFVDEAGYDEATPSNARAVPAVAFPSRSFGLVSGNTDSEGLWGDGSTLWALDSTDRKGYAYGLDDPGTAVDELGARRSSSDVTVPSSISIEGAGVDTANTKVFIGDYQATTVSVRVFSLSGFSRLAGEDFDLPRISAGGSELLRSPSGFLSDGTTLWQVTAGVKSIHAFSLVDDPNTGADEYGARDSAKDIEVSFLPGAMWSDGDTMWAVDDAGDRLAAFDWPTRTANPTRDIALHTKHDDPGQVWGHNGALYSLQLDDNKVYAYQYLNNASGLVVAGGGEPGDVLSADPSGIVDPNGLADGFDPALRWQRSRDNGETWANIDGQTGTEYEIRRSDRGALVRVVAVFVDEAGYDEATPSNARAVPAVAFPSRSFGLVSGNTDSEGLWGDGSTLWALDSTDRKGYAYGLDDPGTAVDELGARRSSSDVTVPSSISIEGAGVDTANTKVFIGDYQATTVSVRVFSLSGFSRLAGEDFDLPRISAGGSELLRSPSGFLSDGTTLWQVTAGVKSIHAFSLVDDPNTGADEYGARDSAKDIEVSFLPGAMWSDGDTMWVLDDAGDRLAAFDWPTRTANPTRDIALHTKHDDPGQVWGHNGALYSLQLDDNKVYAYQYLNNASGLVVAGGGEPGDVLSADPSGIVDPNGLADGFDPALRWQRSRDNGETWANIDGQTGTEYEIRRSDRGALVRVVAVFVDEAGYDEATPSNARAVPAVAFPSRSFGLVSGNTDSEGLWGDGSTLWALDSTDRKGYAYGLDDPGTAVDELGARRSSSDVTVPSSISIEGAGVDTANTKVFIGDYQATTVSVRVFSLSGFSRLAGEDFDLPRISAGGSELLRSPSGFLSDGTTLWQVTAGVKSIHAFSLVDDPNTGADEYGARDSAKDIEVSFLPGAMWSDGDTMWAVDDAGDRLAAFDWPTRTANPTRDIALHTKHDDPGQVWGHNGTLYSLQLDDNKIYAYQYLNNASGLVVAGGGEPGDVLSADPSGIVDPNGLADGFDPALRWQRSRDNGETWANIDGQTGTEYEILRSDRGALVRVVARFVDEAGYDEATPSNARAVPAVAFPSRSFGLVSGNTDSEGLWGDGSTLWALDSTDRKGYAYGLDDPGTAVDELGARRSSSDVTVPSSISIEGAGVDTANTKVFIGDYQATTVSVRVFSLSGFSRLAGEDFDLPRISAGGSELLRSPSGFLSDGTTLWQVTAGVKSIHAFSLVDDPNTGADEYGARDSAKDIEVSFLPGAMWSDGDTMWAVDDAGDRLAAFDWPTRTANPTRDIALHTKHDDPGQVWGHNGALYSLQLDDNKVYAYQYLNNASGLVVAGGGEPGDVLSADPSGIVDPNGLADGFDPALRWQRSRDNGATWANIDGQTGTEYEILRSDRGALVRVVARFVDEAGYDEATPSNARAVPAVAFPSRSFGLVSGNTDSEGLWGDGSTLWALDSTDRKGYAYGLDDPGTAVDELGARRSSSDVTVPSSISIEGAGVDTANTKVFIGDYQATTVSVRVFSLSGFSRLAGEDFDLPRISAGGSELLRSPSGFLSDGTTLWQVTAGVKSIHAFSLVDDPNTGADEYGARDSAKDIEVSFLPGAMWSDGDTMWVLDDAGDRLAAFDWPTRTANPTRDIALHTKHDDPGQVWGHNGALYSLQLDDNKVYAYQYLNNASGLAVKGRPTPGSVLSTDVGEIVDPNGVADPFVGVLQWQRSVDEGATWAGIDGQTGTGYTISRSDLGAQVRLRVSFVDEAGYDEVLRSTGVLVVLPSAASVGLGDAHVTAGGYHTCALLTAGSVQCVGYDKFDQTSDIPALGSMETWELLSAGEFHTCGLVSDGTVKCWGRDNFDQAPASKSASSGEFTWVDAGAWHTCALTDAEAIECWGRNDDGQTDVPELVGSLTWLAVSAGGSAAYSSPGDDGWNKGYTCGLASDGTILCWGAYGPSTMVVNSFDGPVSVDVPGRGVWQVPELDGGLFYTSVTVGGAHACATVSDSSLRCWGEGGPHLGAAYNDNGQSAWSQPEPPAGTAWTSVTAGAYHTCATAGSDTPASKIVCWGNESFLHRIHPTKRAHPTGRFVDDHARFPSVGSWHTCWLHSQNATRVTCKGDNSFGAHTWTNKAL